MLGTNNFVINDDFDVDPLGVEANAERIDNLFTLYFTTFRLI